MNSGKELSLLLRSLCDLGREGDMQAALATITRTYGSSFRRAGTHMLVREDGEVVCELSAGCPQRDLMDRAMEVIREGRPRLVEYNAKSVFDVLMETGCGGRVEVLIEPLSRPGSVAFAEVLEQCIGRRRSVWLATWFTAGGSAVVPRRLVSDGQHIFHEELGDPLLRQSVLQAIGSQPSRTGTVRLASSHGEADVLLESVQPPHALIVIGASATARALFAVADTLGWQATLVDSSPQRLRISGMPPKLRRVCAGPHDVRQKLALDASSSVVVMTHKLEQDIAYLAALREAPVAYFGALASRERAARIREALRGRQIHAPAGLDIGSETPAEIALAVAAEIAAVLNHRSGGRLRDTEGDIHGGSPQETWEAG